MNQQPMGAPQPKVRAWLWIVLIIVILAAGGFGAWYYLMGPGKKTTTTTTPTATTTTPSTTTTTPSTASKTFENKDLGYIFQYPNTWEDFDKTKTYYPDQVSIVLSSETAKIDAEKAKNPSETEYQKFIWQEPIISVQKGNYNSDDLSNCLKLFYGTKNYIPANAKDFTSDFSLKGLSYDGKSDAYNMKTIIFKFPNDNRVILITSIYTSATINPNTAEVLENLASSFKFTQ